MYKFTEEQIMIRDMVREFTKNEVAPYDKAMDETFSFNMEVYQQIYSKLVETGLMGIHIPEQYGGGGGDAITSQIVVNELAKGSASIALYLDANWLASDMILVHGSDEQKQKYLPLAAAGKVFAFGLTEAEIRAEMMPESYIGRCPEQVAAFTAKCLDHELRCGRLLSYHGEDRSRRRRKGHLRFHRPQGCRRSDHRQVRAQNGHERLGHLRAEL